MSVRQGDVYWLKPENPDGVPSIPHPHVVIQVDAPDALVVCGITSNIRRISMPGSVLLEIGEANLTRRSVVEVSKIRTVSPSQLGEYIGSLDVTRIAQIQAGIRFVRRSYLDG